jgi:hypothetical protein
MRNPHGERYSVQLTVALFNDISFTYKKQNQCLNLNFKNQPHSSEFSSLYGLVSDSNLLIKLPVL